MKNQKTGLIIGKFAPLHKGHQFLIETALKRVERLLVLIYDCPDITKVPLATRAGWIRRLYPQVEVIEGYGAPTEHGDSPEVTKKNLEFIKKVLPCPVTHVFSSERYGEILARELEAENILIDKERVLISVSGTMIRSDFKKYKKFLPPLVFKELKH